MATLFTVGLVIASIAGTTRAGARAARAADARAARDATLEAARDRLLHDDPLARLRVPGQWDTVPVGAGGDTAALAVVGRPAWEHLVVRLAVAMPAGAPGTRAATGRRLDLPLRFDLPMPRVPLTGARPWQTVSGTVLELGRDTPADRRCRDTSPAGPALPTAAASPPAIDALLDHPRARPLDLDSVRAPVDGVVVIGSPARVARPLSVDGVLVVAGDLEIAAPLTVRGLLVAGGSVDTRTGGALRLAGAAWSGDAGGGTSRLGPGDTVRWDPCLVRGARDRLARLASPARWRSVHAP